MKLRRDRFCRSQAKAFSIVELLVVMAILSLIMVLLVSIVNQTTGLWQRTTGKMAAFQEARAGFESMTRKLSQATLNTYWDYDPPISEGTPTRYVRQSSLHFLCGRADSLLPASVPAVGHSVFFQAPLGYSEEGMVGNQAPLKNLLNAAGYFIQLGDDNNDRPNFLRNAIPTRHRYRLMELWQPTEQLMIYNPNLMPATSPVDRTAWFVDPITASPPLARPIAENIIALVLLPRHPEMNDGSGLTKDYSYDTRRYLSHPGDPLAELSRHQLPPTIEVTIVAVDDPSAARLEALPEAEKDLLSPGKLFTDVDDYSKDLHRAADDSTDGSLESFLQKHRLNYRVLSTVVSIKQAKWNSQ